jgi:hypothetical protein
MKTRKMTLLWFLLGAWAAGVSAQPVVTNYEYWFDDRYTERQSATTGAGTTTFDFDPTISLAGWGLSHGAHRLHLRFRDSDGRFGPVQSYPFVYAGNITGYDYWFDDAYAQRQTVNVAPQNGEIEISVPTQHLSPDYHVLRVRMRSATGGFGSILNFRFYAAPENNFVARVKYKLLETGPTQTLTLGAHQQQPEITFDISALGAGTHVAHIWLEDVRGNVSPILTHEFEKCMAYALHEVYPNRVGNAGYATLRLTGLCLPPEARYRLLSGGRIITADSAVQAGAHAVDAVFDLHGAPTGVWDVQMIYGADTLLLPQSLTIESGTNSDLAVEVVGRATIVRNMAWRYEVVVTNRGNNDALLVPLQILVSRHVNVTFPGKRFYPELPNFPADSFPTWADLDSLDGRAMEAKGCMLLIPKIAVGMSATLEFWVESPTVGDFPVAVGVGEPLMQSPIRREATECVSAVWGIFADMMGEVAGPYYDCIFGSIRIALDGIFAATHWHYGNMNESDVYADMGKSVFQAVNSCVAAGLPTYHLFRIAWKSIGFAWNAYDAITNCWQTFRSQRTSTRTVRNLTSLDPNEKVGPAGMDANRTTSGVHPLTYTIYFENKDTIIGGISTIPVKICTIYDTLDMQKYNLSTFRFGALGFGGRSALPIETRGGFEATLDYRPQVLTPVRVTGEINEQTGVVKWTFASLDPDSGLPTVEPELGFLPPNRNRPEGEGFVSFSVEARKDFNETLPVRNRAAIYFDANEPIITHTWSNRIDRTPPVSRVMPLPAETWEQTVFTVNWEGTDAGSGLTYYTVYVSDNDSAYKPWQYRVEATSATFVGQYGHTYAFYSVAEDAVQNREAPPVFPDAVTTLLTGRQTLMDAARLYEPYPNPTDGAVVVSFFLPQSADVVVSLTGVDGRRKTLLSERAVPGFNTHTFKIEGPSGVYLVALESGNVRLSRRVVLQR